MAKKGPKAATTASGDALASDDDARPDRPPVPESLDEAGRTVWCNLMEDLPDRFDFTARELKMLENAGRQADLVAELEIAVRESGIMISGAAGQTRLNAAVTELRQSRIAFARLMGELEIPIEDGGKPQTNASIRGRKAAERRWAPQRRERAERA